MRIDCNDLTEKLEDSHLQLVKDLLLFTATKEKIPDKAEVSLSFVTNKEIQKINATYRGIDQPTDVISFALEEEAEGELSVNDADLPLILGDIIISIEKAEEQREAYGHTFERELGFLAVHGILHLLGYDHMNEDDEKIMFGKQEEILGAFDLER